MTKLTKLRNVKASFIGKLEIKKFSEKIIPVKGIILGRKSFWET